MKKLFIIISTIIILSLAIFTGVRMANTPTALSLTKTLTLPTFVNLTEILSEKSNQTSAKYAVAIDNTLVYENTSAIQPTASTAKMILGLMITEKYPINLGETGETITITPELYDFYTWYISHNGSTIPVQIGETISEYDALVATLLPSANNMADALAVWAFGSLSNYQAYATSRLSEWGLENTTIGSDASGFSSDTTSTAADLAIIGQKLMQNPVLSQIVGLKSYTIPIAGVIENTNKLLGIDDISGIKTGYIGPSSGYCLVSAYRLGDHVITISVLDTDTRAESFTLSQNLVETLQASLSSTLIASSGAEVGYYDSWWTGKIPIYLNEDAVVLGWGQSVSSDLIMDGTTGTLSIKSNTSSYDFPVAASNFEAEPSFWQRLKYAFTF